MKKIKLLFFSCFLFNVSFAQLQPEAADSLLHFIQFNKNKSSIFISINDVTVTALNQNKLMPLAGTVQLMVAIEFAKQANKQVINVNSYVSLAEVDKYYLKNTDANAHPNWLKFEQANNNIKNDSVKLLEIARGMMMFSSNANTEYLQDLLGFDNVKNNIQLFGLKKHTAIFPVVSSLFMYQNPHSVKESNVLSAIRSLSNENYYNFIYAIHNQLKNDTTFKVRFRLQDLSVNMQKLWSDRLPASTTSEYIQILKIINNKRYLEKGAYDILTQIIEFPKENTGLNATFKNYGSKGGSTMFALTHIFYLTKIDGEKIEFAVFFNNLDPTQQQQLHRWIEPFEARVILDTDFRAKLKF